MKKGLPVFIVGTLVFFSMNFAYAAEEPCDLMVGGDKDFSFKSIQPDNAPKLDALGVKCTSIVKPKSTSGTQTQQISNDLTGIIKTILSLVTGFIASFAALYAIFRLMGHAAMLAQSGGDATKMEAGKKGIINTVASLFIISIAYMIVYTVINTVLSIPATTNLQEKASLNPSGNIKMDTITPEKKSPANTSEQTGDAVTTTRDQG